MELQCLECLHDCTGLGFAENILRGVDLLLRFTAPHEFRKKGAFLLKAAVKASEKLDLLDFAPDKARMEIPFEEKEKIRSSIYYQRFPCMPSFCTSRDAMQLYAYFITVCVTLTELIISRCWRTPLPRLSV